MSGTHLASSTLVLAMLTACSPDTFTVTVQHGHTLTERVGFADVTVAVDTGADRIEAKTGADGGVEFELSWDDGPIDVTIDTGRGLRTYLGLTEADDGFDAWFLDASGVSTTTLAGTAQPRTLGLNLAVWPQVGGSTASLTTSDPFEVEVPVDTPLTLIAFEYSETRQGSGALLDRPCQNWQRISHDPISGPTELAIDLTQTVDPLVGAGTIEVPLGPLRGNGTVADVWVLTEASGYMSKGGWATHSDTTTPGGDVFEYDLEWLEAVPGESLLTQLQVISGPGDALAEVVTPHSLTLHSTLLPVPTFDPDGPPSLDAPVLFRNEPVDAHGIVRIEGGEHPWTIIGPLGERRIDVPAPPSTFSFGDAAVAMRPGLLQQRADLDWSTSLGDAVAVE